jgi:NAD(P)-dependent dehydrogenase (short-subunit alcohol dehydrogenase family)
MGAAVALVTGASRGIGKGIAIALAEAGFDVAIAARTVREGEGRDFGTEDRPIVGSMQSTADAIEATGRRALAVRMDLLDRGTWQPAVDEVLTAWSRVDVLVNNARFQAPDHKARFIDVSVDSIDVELGTNLLAPVALAKAVLPNMLERGSGTIVNLTSTAGYMNPPATADRGGWSTSYALAKGGLQRIAGMIAVELGDRGINAFNLNPGFVLTERNSSKRAELGTQAYVGAPPSAIGAVVAWFASNPEAAAFNGMTIEGQRFALERGLCPDWRPPGADLASMGPDASVW